LNSARINSNELKRATLGLLMSIVPGGEYDPAGGNTRILPTSYRVVVFILEVLSIVSLPNIALALR